MSYILDALVKSEKERQQGKLPSIGSQQDNEPPPRKKKTRWPFWLIGALLLNVAILLWWIRPWQVHEGEQPVAAVAEGEGRKRTTALDMPISSPAGIKHVQDGPAARPAPPVPEGQGKREEEADAIPSLPDKQPTSPDTVAAIDETADTLGPAAEDESISAVGGSDEEVYKMGQEAEEEIFSQNQVDEESPESTMAEAPARKVDSSSTANSMTEKSQPADSTGLAQQDSLPRRAPPDISQLPASILKELPEISILLHLYSKKPQRRKVSVNGRMLREGERLGDLTVEEITSDGVIFSFHGKRFHKGVFR